MRGAVDLGHRYPTNAAPRDELEAQPALAHPGVADQADDLPAARDRA